MWIKIKYTLTWIIKLKSLNYLICKSMVQICFIAKIGMNLLNVINQNCSYKILWNGAANLSAEQKVKDKANITASTITNSWFKKDVNYMKVEALIYNIQLVKDMDFTPLIIETDLRNVIKLITRKEESGKKIY